MGDVLAPLRPTLDNVWEIAIEEIALFSWLPLRKGPSRQPALHRASSHSYLPGNCLITQPLLV